MKQLQRQISINTTGKTTSPQHIFNYVTFFSFKPSKNRD